jgi:hypothetical protein
MHVEILLLAIVPESEEEVLRKHSTSTAIRHEQLECTLRKRARSFSISLWQYPPSITVAHA